jgi:isoleucyl-tRNA synthetase
MMPFLAELLWRRVGLPGESVHAQEFPRCDEALIDADLEESMRMVTRVVEMGRSLRERAGIRIRQPLRAIHLRASHAHAVELLQRSFAREEILGELNIKGYGSVALDDGQLCVLKAKANFRTLGKRLGAKMKAAAAAIEALEAPRVAELRAGGAITIVLADECIEITPEDVQVLVETRASFDLETDGRLVAFLDTALDDELREEGLFREAVSRLNALRKERGLAVEDRIRLRLDGGGQALLERALTRFWTALAEETLCAESSRASLPPEATALELEPGLRLLVELEKA